MQHRIKALWRFLRGRNTKRPMLKALVSMVSRGSIGLPDPLVIDGVEFTNNTSAHGMPGLLSPDGHRWAFPLKVPEGFVTLVVEDEDLKQELFRRPTFKGISCDVQVRHIDDGACVELVVVGWEDQAYPSGFGPVDLVAIVLSNDGDCVKVTYPSPIGRATIPTDQIPWVRGEVEVEHFCSEDERHDVLLIDAQLALVGEGADQHPVLEVHHALKFPYSFTGAPDLTS